MKKYKSMLIASGILFTLFIIITALTLTGVFSPVEDWAFRVADAIGYPRFREEVVFFARLGWWWVVITMAFILLVLPWTRRRFAIPMFLSFGLATIATIIVKVAANRTRPRGYGSFLTSSFPSGHTMNSTSFYIAGVIILFFMVKQRKWVIPFIVMGILLPFSISISRVYTKSHFLGDILAGWTLGAAIALASIVLWQLIAQFSNWFTATKFTDFKFLRWLHKFTFPEEFWEAPKIEEVQSEN